MEFDLEAAKRGDPIECQEAYGWVELPFIGVWDAEHVVCKAPWNDKPEIVNVSKLRMVRKRKQVVRYRRYISGYYSEEALVETINEGFTHPSEIPDCSDFIEWIDHDWQEYEIGANDVPCEEKEIDGVLCWRVTPSGEWTPFTAKQLTEKIRELQEDICALYEDAAGEDI